VQQTSQLEYKYISVFADSTYLSFPNLDENQTDVDSNNAGTVASRLLNKGE
jgi:hypothetical protein